MRTRELFYADDLVNYSCAFDQEWHDCRNGTCQKTNSLTSHTYSSCVPFTSHVIMTDVETPDFYKRMKSGEIINNPMTKVATHDFNYPGYYSLALSHSLLNDCCKSNWSAYGGGQVASTEYLSFTNLLTPSAVIDVESLKAQAVSKAWANVSASSANVLASIGELQETIGSIVSIFKRFIKIYKAFKKWDLKCLLGELTPKELANRYMEARYAIRPLIYDINNYIDAWNAYQTSNIRTTFRSSKSVNDSKTEIVTDGNLTIQYDINVECVCRAGVLTKIDEVTVPMLLGITEPCEAIWELVPFSFIIDWFFNISDVISSWTPNVGITDLASWVTVKTTYITQASLIGYNHIPDPSFDKHSVHVSGCKLKRSVTDFVRIPNPPRGILPQFDLNLDAFKIADMAIILKGLLSK